MSEQPTDWDNYQVPVDASVPNPVAGTKSDWHGRDGRAGGLGLRPDLQLQPLGGGYQAGWRRITSLVACTTGALLVGVGLVLPWAIVRQPDGSGPQAVPFWEDYPNACVAVVAVTVASLALIVADRARYFVTAFNLFAAVVIVFATGQTQNANAALNAGAESHTLHVLGVGWVVLFAGVALCLVASVVQPRRPR